MRKARQNIPVLESGATEFQVSVFDTSRRIWKLLRVDHVPDCGCEEFLCQTSDVLNVDKPIVCPGLFTSVLSDCFSTARFATK